VGGGGMRHPAAARLAHTRLLGGGERDEAEAELRAARALLQRPWSRRPSAGRPAGHATDAPAPGACAAPPQVAHSPYKGVVDCTQQILRREGVGALFRSYRTTLVMNIPFTAVHFSVYEGAKKWLMGVGGWGWGWGGAHGRWAHGVALRWMMCAVSLRSGGGGGGASPPGPGPHPPPPGGKPRP